MSLNEIEKDYLKEFIRITNDNGVYGLVKACENKEFSIVSLTEIISNLLNETEKQKHNIFNS